MDALDMLLSEAEGKVRSYGTSSIAQCESLEDGVIRINKDIRRKELILKMTHALIVLGVDRSNNLDEIMGYSYRYKVEQENRRDQLLQEQEKQKKQED